MAIARVNEASGTFGAGPSGTVTTPATSLTAGNRCIVSFRWTTSGITVTSVADTAGNTYTLIRLHASETTTSIAVYECNDCLGDASNVITATFSAGATNYSACAVQYSGLGDYDIVVAASSHVGTGDISRQTFNISDGLVLNVVQVNAASGTWAAGSGMTLVVEDSANVQMLAEAIVTSATSVVPSPTSSSNAAKDQVAVLFAVLGSGSPSPGGSYDAVQRLVGSGLIG